MSGRSANDNEPDPQQPVPHLREGRARQDVKPPLPKRFYATVAVVETLEGHQVVLDGRPVKTPAKRPLAVPTRALADGLAAEWAAQAARIDPATMPLTKLANTTIDAVVDRRADVAADLTAYAGHDALCYRAEAPAELVERQAASWDGLLAWAEALVKARFNVTTGVVAVTQPAALTEAFAAELDALDPWVLAPLHVITVLTGSAVLALAVHHGHVTPEQAWDAAHVDENWQIGQWGQDAEAEARRTHRWSDMDAACRFLTLAKDD